MRRANAGEWSWKAVEGDDGRMEVEVEVGADLVGKLGCVSDEIDRMEGSRIEGREGSGKDMVTGPSVAALSMIAFRGSTAEKRWFAGEKFREKLERI